MKSPVHPDVASMPLGDEPMGGEERRLRRAGALLGSGKLFKQTVHSKADLHSAIMAGAFPNAYLVLLISKAEGLELADIVRALGISKRLLGRRRDAPSRSLSPALASRHGCLQ